MRSDYTKIAVVLDRSGSMEACRDATISGFNEFIQQQNKVPGHGDITLVTFSTDVHSPTFEDAPIKEVRPLNRDTYTTLDMTALLDAVGSTMTKLGEKLHAMPEDKRPGKVIVVIITDGLENASKSWDWPRIKALIKQQREIYSWEVLFIGANIDAVVVGAQMGLPKDNSLTYTANAVGTRHAFASAARATASYRGGMTARFVDSDRTEQEDAKA